MVACYIDIPEMYVSDLSPIAYTLIHFLSRQPKPHTSVICTWLCLEFIWNPFPFRVTAGVFPGHVFAVYWETNTQVNKLILRIFYPYILEGDILYNSSVSIMNAENSAVLNMDYVTILPEDVLNGISSQFEANFISTAHTEKEIVKTIRANFKSLEALL